MDGPYPAPIFVIGTGRSGTHWLGYTVGAHPEVHATVEADPMFTWVATMAQAPAAEDALFPLLAGRYREQIAAAFPRRYLDKSHPNIWLAEKLKDAFPEAQFLGIERNPFATVASMILKQGVKEHHLRWRHFPVPNRFLGIDDELAPVYDDLPLAARCAHRWVAHRKEMARLRTTMGSSLLVLQYESFSTDPAAAAGALTDFLGLGTPLEVPGVRVESRHKWRSQLTSLEIDAIGEVVGFGPEEPVNESAVPEAVTVR